MGYELYNKNGQLINHHDLQDKGPWCKHGSRKEEVFVELNGKKLGLKINPEKETNPYAPDLLNTTTDLLGDLKTQNTPFFQAKIRYDIDPQHAVVFNTKDRYRYEEHYPEIEIYFWVNWEAVKFEGNQIIEVKPMEGVWFVPFQKLLEILDKAPVHSYQQRVYDTRGNAKGSYVIDLRHENFKQVI